MELIDRYVNEVGRHLPAGLRADVEAELRSLLADSLDERSRAAGRPPDTALAAEVLKDFGKPREVATRYAPQPQYLIGPPLYPVYVRVLKIVVAGCGVVALVLMALGMFRTAGQPASLSVLVRATESFLSGVLYNLGLITLVFALVERAVQLGDRHAAPWDPAKLPPVNDPDRISYFGRIFLLYWIAAVALLFNVFPDWIGVVMITDGAVRVLRLLEPAFGRYLPFMNALWAGAFVLNLLVLREGRWTKSTRWAEFALELGNAAFAAVVVTGPPVFRYDGIVKLVLSWFLVATLIRAAVQLYRLWIRRPPQPWLEAH
jgi:hypothetical protein